MASPHDNRPQSMAGASIDNVNMRYNTPVTQWWQCRILHDQGCTQQYVYSYAGSPCMWIGVPTKPAVFQIIGPMLSSNSTQPQPSPVTSHDTEAGYDALARHPKRPLSGAQHSANDQDCGPDENTGTNSGVYNPTGPDDRAMKRSRVGSITAEPSRSILGTTSGNADPVSKKVDSSEPTEPVSGGNVIGPDASVTSDSMEIYEDAIAGREILPVDSAGDSVSEGGFNAAGGGWGGRLQHRTGFQ